VKYTVSTAFVIVDNVFIYSGIKMRTILLVVALACLVDLLAGRFKNLFLLLFFVNVVFFVVGPFFIVAYG
jgi:hypothetical protein